METSQLICRANQLPGFYMMATLAFNELMLECSLLEKIKTFNLSLFLHHPVYITHLNVICVTAEFRFHHLRSSVTAVSKFSQK